MPYLIIRKVKNKRYCYIAESERDGKKVKQKILRYLGSEDLLKEVGIILPESNTNSKSKS